MEKGVRHAVRKRGGGVVGREERDVSALVGGDWKCELQIGEPASRVERAMRVKRQPDRMVSKELSERIVLAGDWRDDCAVTRTKIPELVWREGLPQLTAHPPWQVAAGSAPGACVASPSC